MGMLSAACRGGTAEVFFASDGGGVEAAKRVCARCAVQVECLEYALRCGLTYGVWGGASERTATHRQTWRTRLGFATRATDPKSHEL